jgi:predicted chitinase
VSKEDAEPVREVRVEDLAGYQAALVPEMRRSRIVTKNPTIAFLANISQETDNLKTLEECGNESYFCSFFGDSRATTARLHHEHKVPAAPTTARATLMLHSTLSQAQPVTAGSRGDNE